MNDAPVVEFTTNSRDKSIVEAPLTCPDLWSMGQERAIQILSEVSKSFWSGAAERKLVSSFSARAARIAAAYARIYLELEESGRPELKGRFYWMGLAAFASKQVKCGLDFIPDDPALVLMPPVVQGPMRIGKNGLGKGNFWLFQDIYVWHWFYMRYPEQFEKCSAERNVNSYRPKVLENVKVLPWAKDALGKIKYFSVTSEISLAFKLIHDSETTKSRADRRDLQFRSLVEIANHEQLKILQPLIYDDSAFRRVLDVQAMMEAMPGTPKRVAAFCLTCDSEKDTLRVQMKSGGLYDQVDRMAFIFDIANRYHKLMLINLRYMEETIGAISTWSHQG